MVHLQVAKEKLCVRVNRFKTIDYLLVFMMVIIIIIKLLIQTITQMTVTLK